MKPARLGTLSSTNCNYLINSKRFNQLLYSVVKMVKLIYHLFKNGFQFPCMEGFWVSRGFLSFKVFNPEADLNSSTWVFTSLTDKFFRHTTLVLLFTNGVQV